MRNVVKRIGLFGAFGFNRGDDALALSLIEGFRHRRRNIEFIVPVLKPGAFGGLSNVQTFLLDRGSLHGALRLIKAIAAADAVILGAGSIIQDKLGGGYFRGTLGYSCTVATLCRILRKPSVTGPIGVDALSSKRNEIIARWILSQPQRVFVRDNLSAMIANAFLNVGARRRVTVVCDPVFGWDMDSRFRKTDTLVLAPAFEGHDERRIGAIHTYIAQRWLSTHPTSQVCFLAMDERAAQDGGKVRALVDSYPLNLRARIVVKCPTTAQEAVRIVRSAKRLVAMRLHALILAYGYVDMFCISRTTKTDAFMQTYGVSGLALSSKLPADQFSRVAVDYFSGKSTVRDHKKRLVELQMRLVAYYKDALECLDNAINCGNNI